MSLSSSTRCVADVGASIPQPSDVAVDTLGKFAAVGGENGTVAVLDLAASASPVATLPSAHQSAVLRVAWAHHRFGRLFATVAENEIKLWRDADQKHTYREVATFPFQSGVYSAAWSPQEYGPMLAAAGADGQVTIFSTKAADLSQWDQQSFTAHPKGAVYSVSWSPALAPGSIIQMSLGLPQQGGAAAAAAPLTVPAPRVVTCGAERSIRIWRYLAQDHHWLQEQELANFPAEVTTVRDVAWAPNPGLPFAYVAAAAEEGCVGVWLQDGIDGKWHYSALSRQWSAPVCRVGWSSAGSLLTVAVADGSNSVWRETPTGEWVAVHESQQH